MTIIGRIVDAVLHDPQQPRYGYNSPGMAGPNGPNGAPIYYTTASCDMCANSIHGCRHCRRMTRRDARCMRRDMRDMRRAARWDTLLSPVTGRLGQSPQNQTQTQTQTQQYQYGPQYSQEPYVPQEYGSAQQGRDAREHQASPTPRQSSVYNVPAPAGPPPPYVLEETVRKGGKDY